jgi:hypothetical protein
MPHSPLARVAVAIPLLASPLSAQSWQSIGEPSSSNSGAYWNNASDDNVANAVCNAGAIVTNTPALATGSCNNQAPNPFLPLSPAPLTTANVFLSGASGTNPRAGRVSDPDYNDIIIRFGHIPEPETAVMLGLGFIALALYSRGRRPVLRRT